eukprot:3553726-Rhodomonas_salina.1
MLLFCRDATSGTDIAYGTKVFRSRHAEPGRSEGMLLPGLGFRVPCFCDAMSGTELGYAATRRDAVDALRIAQVDPRP